MLRVSDAVPDAVRKAVTGDLAEATTPVRRIGFTGLFTDFCRLFSRNRTSSYQSLVTW
jgi:hypothetical protein